MGNADCSEYPLCFCSLKEVMMEVKVGTRATVGQMMIIMGILLITVLTRGLKIVMNTWNAAETEAETVEIETETETGMTGTEAETAEKDQETEIQDKRRAERNG